MPGSVSGSVLIQAPYGIPFCAHPSDYVQDRSSTQLQIVLSPQSQSLFLGSRLCSASAAASAMALRSSSILGRASRASGGSPS